MQPNAALPSHTLKAVVSGREFDLGAIDRNTVLVFHGQNTATAAIEVNNAVRAVFPDPREVLIASVIDLRQFPSMFHAMVKPELEKAYHKAAGKLPPGTEAADLVVLLPDWKGTVSDACGISDSPMAAVVLVVQAGGRVAARITGNQPGQAAVAALQGL